MTQPQISVSALDGLQTIKKSGILADQTLLAALSLTAWPASFRGCFDLKVVSGTLYITVNGDAADANAMPVDAGEKMAFRNCLSMATKIHVFSSAAVDVRVALYAGGGIL